MLLVANSLLHLIMNTTSSYRISMLPKYRLINGHIGTVLGIPLLDRSTSKRCSRTTSNPLGTNSKTTGRSRLTRRPHLHRKYSSRRCPHTHTQLHHLNRLRTPIHHLLRSRWVRQSSSSIHSLLRIILRLPSRIQCRIKPLRHPTRTQSINLTQLPIPMHFSTPSSTAKCRSCTDLLLLLLLGWPNPNRDRKLSPSCISLLPLLPALRHQRRNRRFWTPVPILFRWGATAPSSGQRRRQCPSQ